VSVAKVEDGLGPVRGEPTKLEEEGKLYAVAPVAVIFPRHGQVGLKDSHKVPDVYRYLLPLLGVQLVLFGQFPEDLLVEQKRLLALLPPLNDYQNY